MKQRSDHRANRKLRIEVRDLRSEMTLLRGELEDTTLMLREIVRRAALRKGLVDDEETEAARRRAEFHVVSG